jgi:hypothetical protein
VRSTAKWVDGAWPDNICAGYLDYSPSSVYEGGFVLRDFNHGIPVLGSVHAETFNYPGQTEDITKRLVACWNACVGISTDDLVKRSARQPEGGGT